MASRSVVPKPEHFINSIFILFAYLKDSSFCVWTATNQHHVPFFLTILRYKLLFYAISYFSFEPLGVVELYGMPVLLYLNRSN